MRKHIRRSERRNAVYNGTYPADYCGIVSAVNGNICVFAFYKINRFLFLCYRRSGLYGTSENNGHSVCYAAVYAAVVVRFADRFSVFDAERIVAFACSFCRKSEAQPEVHAFNSAETEKCVRKNTFKSIEPRLSHTCWKPAYRSLRYTSHTVIFGSCGKYFFGHLRPALFFKRRKYAVFERFNVFFDVLKITVVYSCALQNVRAYLYAEFFKRGQYNAPRRNKSRGYSARKMTSAAIVFISVILAKSGVIGVRRTRKPVLIIFTLRVFVRNYYADGRTRCFVVENAADYTEIVIFSARSVRRGGRTATGKHSFYVFFRNFDSGRKSVQNHPDRFAVAFSEYCRADALSERVFHLNSPF